MRHIALLLLCALLLGGCTRRSDTASPTAAPALAPAATLAPIPEPTPAATPEATSESAAPAAIFPASIPSPTPAPPVIPGSYRWEAEDGAVWLLNIKSNGTFAVIGGERIFNGEGWSDNGDGTVTTGPTEAAGAAPFFDEFGSSVWRIDGEGCWPIY